ncbi:hypothetical protein FG87_15165 [Nocardia vulneris]|uniref:Uncharacterized protein n=2 Tax=Nocardia vulneris TaxID=1141657 RepID=A0ABR4ZH16_9NOCA|nr:hypothetical protein FG87_15165 [Nocardia vulneris]
MKKLVMRAVPGALLAILACAAPAHAAPVNAQQARDTCLDYLLQTIRAMPEGTYLEAAPDSSLPPGHILQTGTGSAFLPRAEHYSLGYRLLSDSSSAVYAGAEAAWESFGWELVRKPPYPNGATETQVRPADGYLLDVLLGVGDGYTVVTLACSTTEPFPGGGPAPTPVPSTLTR